MTHIIVKDGAVSVSGGRVVTDAGGAPCCCGPGGGDGGVIDGNDVQCITLTMQDIVSMACFRNDGPGTTDPACDGLGDRYFRRTAGTPIGMSTPIKLPLHDIPDQGWVYVYGIGLPFQSPPADPIKVSWAVEGERYAYYTVNRNFQTYCETFVSFTREAVTEIDFIYVAVSYEPSQAPEIVGVSMGCKGFIYEKFTTHNAYDGTEVIRDRTRNTDDDFYRPFSRFFNGDTSEGRPWRIGDSIPNADELPTVCTEGFEYQNLVGSLRIDIDPDDSCLDAIQVFKAEACGTPTGGQPSVIYVDLGARPKVDADNGRIYPVFNNWPYVLTDEHEPNQSPFTVTWRADPCFPLARLCNIPSVTGGYDPRGRPPNGQTIVDGNGFRWVPIEGTSATLDITGAWEDTPCPGTTMMAPANTGPQKIVRNATQQFTGGTGDVFADVDSGVGGADSGGALPTDSVALSDLTDTDNFGLGDAVERAIKAITLNQLATCPACQRRREVLNQFGLTVGRAVLRRLGW
jgi:hypothetical protein